MQGKNEIEDRKLAIIEAAYQLFGQQGYAQTSIKRIAEKAGVAHGLVIHHFKSKENLLLEVVKEWIVNRGMVEIFDELQDISDPNELVLGAVGHVSRFRNENQEWFTLLISLWLEARIKPNLLQKVEELYEAIRRTIKKLLISWSDDWSEEQLELVATLILALLDGLTLQSPAKPGEKIGIMGNQGVQLILS